MTEPVESTDPIAPLTVEGDVPCRKCSYNLRGLPLGGQCPECGTAVARSVGGNLIRYSDPQWVAGLSKGVRLILWAILIQFLAGFFGGFLGATRMSAAPSALVAVFFVAAVLEFWGSWLLTEPDPSALGEAEYGTARRVVRVTLLIGIIVAALGFGQQLSALPPSVMLILTGVKIIGGLANLVGYIAQLYYLEHLVLRIPEPKLSKRAGFLKFAIGWTYGAVVLIGAVFVLVGRGLAVRGSAGWVMPVGCAAAIAGLLLLIFGVMALFLLISLNRSLKIQLAAAQEFWVSQAPANG